MDQKASERQDYPWTDFSVELGGGDFWPINKKRIASLCLEACVWVTQSWLWKVPLFVTVAISFSRSSWPWGSKPESPAPKADSLLSEPQREARLGSKHEGSRKHITESGIKQALFKSYMPTLTSWMTLVSLTWLYQIFSPFENVELRVSQQSCREIIDNTYKDRAWCLEWSDAEQW